MPAQQLHESARRCVLARAERDGAECRWHIIVAAEHRVGDEASHNLGRHWAAHATSGATSSVVTPYAAADASSNSTSLTSWPAAARRPTSANPSRTTSHAVGSGSRA